MMDIYPYDPETLSAILAETDAVVAAIRAAGQDAVIQHQQLGLPMVFCRDGQVTLVPADELPFTPPTMQ
jgi:hypothetical protein